MLSQEDKIFLNCYSKIDSIEGKVYINVEIKNNGSENIFLPISHWEIDGIDDTTDAFLGYPNDSYIVNRIHYYPASMKSNLFNVVGDKGDYPDYSNLPYFLKIGKGEAISIVIIIEGRTGNVLYNGKYVFDIEVCYCTQREWNILKKNFSKADKAVCLSNYSPRINIYEMRKVTLGKLSSVPVPHGKSEFIRQLLNRRLACGCISN